MSWSGSRRLGIILIVALFVAIALGGVLALVLPKEPSCSDGIWNQDETGIDCGGSCAYLCKASVVLPSVSFVRTLQTNGRIDVAALVENRNPAANVKGARYAIEFFGPDGAPQGSIEGVMDLPAGESVPVFIPSVLSSGTSVAKAFLSFDEASLNWKSTPGKRPLPRADAIQIAGTPGAPRVTANLFNPSAYALKNLTVVATVYDAGGAVIAATQTLVESLAPEASVPISFSWNEPFISAPGKVTVQAIVPLP